jgi:hypothetical protein
VDISLHLSDDQLELYALDRMGEIDEDRVESHLILCDPCRHRLDEIGVFAYAMRNVLRAHPPHRDEVRAAFPWNLFSSRAWHLPAFALGCVVALLVAMLVFRATGPRRDLAPLATLTLTASRGSGKTANSVAKPARRYDLVLADASRTPAVVKVFDAGGTEVWKGPTGESPAGPVAKVTANLPKGLYIARLESPSGETLHEYAFEVGP